MAIYTMYPVINAQDLEEAVNVQFGVEIGEICSLLFDDDYQNDCCKYFYYGDMEKYKDWMSDIDEEAIRLRNLVRAYLQDTIPDYTCVLIDVSW